MKNVVFYGTRGTFPKSSKRFMEFGQATSCILFNLEGKHLMVDCGTGIENAIDDIKSFDELHLFISHGHFDHICGIPELLEQFKNKKLHIYGKTYKNETIEDEIEGFVNETHWPVRLKEYKNVLFHEIKSTFTIGDVKIETMDSNHPGGCTLFKFITEKEQYVTAFDFSHLDGFENKLIEFARGSDLLIYDGTFSKEEIEKHKEWGHSTPEDGARIGLKAAVKDIVITHYGNFDDIELNKWEKEIQKLYPNVTFARSGQTNELSRVIEIGTLLGTEKDNDQLIYKILESCMDMTNADGGSLYLLENGMLNFKVLINKSKGAHLIRKNIPIGLPSVDIRGKNVCAAAAREKKLINIKNCYVDSKYDFSGAREYDRINDYLTQSVIVVPMIDEYDDVVGVLQLINAIDEHGDVVPFKKEYESILMGITNQASISMVNATYSQKINDLLFGFVKVASYGIGASLSPYNRDHTANMERFGSKFLDYEIQKDGKYKVDQKKKKEILMSILLHDVGKFAVPPEVMNKSTRLGSMIEKVEHRFERRELLLMIYHKEGKLNDAAYADLEGKRRQQLELVREINNVGFLTEDLKERLDALYKKQYLELDGTMRNIITSEEYYALGIPRGTLTPEERAIMEKHVVTTREFLEQLDFPKYYDCIPEYASNHHEFLNGSGYPNHLTEKDLSWPARFITILDIFEALTANNRPYKKPFTIEQSFDILYEMCEQGKLDIKIVKEFENSKAWE